ncbi:uncharacterized protein LOC128388528 [Panonychus citri]|uniref:uncharacterized protein LOC128388528 n=1 Tax=Panonychus citri TaxID=50023 RepID=UPI002307772F|nr:uncharacterized protein LOC128388528 [Panonychus citri]
MSLLGARLLALVGLFGLTMIAGLGPVIVFILWRRRQERLSTLNDLDEPLGVDIGSGGGGEQRPIHGGKSAKVLHLLLVFGGGVLLATCFVHMIPEIQENYQNYLNNQQNHNENNTIKSTAPIMILTNDSDNHDRNQRNTFNQSRVRVNYYTNDEYSSDDSDQEGGDGQSDKTPWVEISICCGLFLTYFIEEIILLLIGQSAHHHHHGDHHEIVRCLPEGEAEGDYGTLIRPVNGSKKTTDGSMTSSPFEQSRSRLSSNDTFTKSIYDNGSIVGLRGKDLPTSPLTVENVHNHQQNLDKLDSQWTRFARGLIIVVAFLAHSIFDGVAIGLQSTVSSLWTMFFAICLHKLVVVFAIGFELYEKTCSLSLTAVHITLFSAMSPLGIILAILTEQGLSEDGSLTLILLNAAATGAILYIVFLEILQADRCPEISGLAQLFSLVIGFTLMTTVTLKVSDGD